MPSTLLIDQVPAESDVTSALVACRGHQIAFTTSATGFATYKIYVSDNAVDWAEFPVTWRFDEDDNSNRPTAIGNLFDQPIAFNANVAGFKYVRLRAANPTQEAVDLTITYTLFS